MPSKTLQIQKRTYVRSSTAEFLVFTKQAGENGKSSDSWIEVRVEDGTIWLSQPLNQSLLQDSGQT